MGIRRRRKKVNTILTTIDRRLKSVELQRVPRVVKDGTITKKMLSKEVKISLETSEDASTNNPGTSTPSNPPTFRTNPYTNIVKIIYRGYNEVGTANDRDRARVYFETDPGLNVGDKIKFASLTGTLDVPTKTAEYTVKEVAEVDGYHTIVYYPGRATIVNGPKTYDKGWRVKASNVSVTGAIVDGTTTTYKYGQIVLDLKDTTPSTDDDYKWGPTWPAGIDTLSGLHFTGGGFNVGDLINLDGLGTLFDGTHKITMREKVGYKLTLQFEFNTYPTAPVTLPNSSGSVRGAAGRYLRDGETWTDTSVEPAITWIWDDSRQRWWNAADGGKLPDGVVVDDGVPPSPPTGLSGTSEGYSIGSTSYSKVQLSWTAPTTNSDGTNLSDLKGYAVYYRYSTQDEWVFSEDVIGATSATISELKSATNVYFSVKAFDLTRNMSSFATPVEILTVAGSSGLLAPSTPVTTSKLGQIRVTWDGLDSVGATPPIDQISHVQVHWSTTSGFTPSATTNKGRLYGKNDFFSDIDPAYNTNYYFKFVFVDIHDKTSPASAEKLATVTPLVNTDLIENSLTRWPFGPSTINVNSLATGSISATQLVSGNDADGTAVRIVDKIAAGTIGATSVAANSIVAGKLAANSVTASTISALSISAGKIQANAIEADKIDAGAVTAQKIAARAITGDKILATTTIRFASYDDGSGGPGASSDQVVIGNHVVAGYNGNVTVTGLSFYRSGSRAGILGSGTWADMSVGADEIGNALQYVNNGNSTYDVYLRSTASITISSSYGTNVFGDLRSYGYFYSAGGGKLQGPIEFSGGRIEVVTNQAIPATAGFRIFTSNPAAFGIWANETYRDSSSSASAITAALLHADTSAMVLKTKNVVVTSTRDSKEDILEYPTDKRVLDIQPKTFRYKNEDPTAPKYDKHLGLIAEEVDELGLDMLISRDRETGKPMAIDYMKIAVLLAPIVKELETRLSTVEEKLDSEH